MSADELTEGERTELMRFLCSFAWADGEVVPQEKAVLERVLGALNMSPEARAKVEPWLSTPPDVEGRELKTIDDAKRDAFIDFAYEVAAADGEIAADELKHMKMFLRFTYGSSD